MGANIYLNNRKVVESASRGHTLVVINPINNSVVFKKTYDTYGNLKSVDSLISDLKIQSEGNIICLITYDATTCSWDMRTLLNNEYGGYVPNSWK